MWQVLGYILLASMVIGVIGLGLQLAVVVLVIVGLVVRPKETVSLLMLGGVITAFKAHPLIVVGIVGVLLAIGFYRKRKAAEALPAPDD